ncbi:hypothetical protein GJAV_G00238580 [Gymnothorax javanicus]|nr:hypothetical protein GJAV_G00238580 [Gymnothorax javanicus]
MKAYLVLLPPSLGKILRTDMETMATWQPNRRQGRDTTISIMMLCEEWAGLMEWLCHRGRPVKGAELGAQRREPWFETTVESPENIHQQAHPTLLKHTAAHHRLLLCVRLEVSETDQRLPLKVIVNTCEVGLV